jgi:hypothetical protein
MFGEEIEYAAEASSMELPEHLRDAYCARRCARTFTCITAAAEKVLAAIAA